MTDSHCHLASDRFGPDELEGLIHRARQHQVTRMVSLSTGTHDLDRTLSLAENHPEIYAAIGVHPCDVLETPDTFLEKIETAALSHSKVVAIGETGLDYYHPAPKGTDAKTYHERQRVFLEKHFELAASSGKNIVIHTRDQEGMQSVEDALRIYERYAQKVRAVFHCFIHDLDTAQKIISLGGLVSFTGITTFKNPGSTLEVVKSLPPGSFMIETDSPYLAPSPYRGKRNEPGYTSFIAQVIAQTRGEDLDSCLAQIESTTEHFFQFS